MITEAFFIVSIGILFYSYIGYGIVAKILSLLIKERDLPELQNVDYPEVTHIIAAYNEQDILKEKINNSLSLDYPEGQLKTIIVTDGSTDSSADIARLDGRVVHYHSEKRNGKLAAVNRVISDVSSPITIFSDANAMLNKESIKNMARHFQSNRVGAVAGEKKVLVESEDDATSGGEGLYWKYESWLKQKDHHINTVVGAAGELFAVRTHLYESPKSNMLIEDFITSMTIAKKGYRVAYEPKAVATETSSANITEEIKRKVRISAGGLQAVVFLKALLNPFKYGMLTFQYVSHRVLRCTLAPVALIVALISNVLLLQTGNMVYGLLLVSQFFFYSLALLGYHFKRKKIKFKAALMKNGENGLMEPF